MNINPPTPMQPARSAETIAMGQGASGTGGGMQAVRADWQLTLNVFHSHGFVGGAGRLLVHNEQPGELSELTLYLPAAHNTQPGTMRLLGATIVSAKPGMPAQPGQPLVVQDHGMKAVLTLPVLRHNDWMYIDLTWDGGFPQGGSAWPGGAVPVGQFHPQVAAEVETEHGQKALAPLSSRYEVTLGVEPGAQVRVEGEAEPASHPSPDGQLVQYEFRSYGSAAVKAVVTAPATG